jgi:hypothetical protein
MRVLAITVGTVLVLGAFYDALTTTLLVGAGAGPVTRRVTGLLWRAALRSHGERRRSALLGAGGSTVLLTAVLVWVLMLWLGWSLILLSGHPAVIDAKTGASADPSAVIYYAGFTLFTLGVGDYIAAGSPWRILTAVAGFSGLFLITMAITYLISVISAVVNRRAVAAHVQALGSRADDIVRQGWTGHDFSAAFVQHLVALTALLSTVGEQHLVYPVLHYFRSEDPAASAPLAVARLDDALLLICCGMPPSARPPVSATEPLRAAVSRYVATVAATSAIRHDPPAPPPPDLAGLRSGGLPAVPVAVFREAVRAEEQHRRNLHRLVHGDGRDWDAVQAECPLTHG